MYPETYTYYHQSVTVHSFGPARYNGQRCYRVDLSGADARYTRPLQIIAHKPIDATVTRYWYIPDSNFDRDFAAPLDAAGDWPAEDDA